MLNCLKQAPLRPNTIFSQNASPSWVKNASRQRIAIFEESNPGATALAGIFREDESRDLPFCWGFFLRAGNFQKFWGSKLPGMIDACWSDT